jgi:putative endopeptidase
VLSVAPALFAEQELIPNGFDVAYMDTSVSPGDDFYRYANGLWQDQTEIPEDRSRWGAFDTLGENNWRRIRNLLEEVAADPGPVGTSRAKIAAFYNSAMNTETIDAVGISPLEPEFVRIDAISDLGDLARYVAEAHAGIGSPFFDAYAYADQKNNSEVIMQFIQGGLSLPDRDYYFEEKHAEYLPQFVEHMATMLELAGTPSEQARAEAELILAFETQLAGFSKTVAELRDPEANYHMMSREEAATALAPFPLETYLETLGVPASETYVDLRQLAYLESLAGLLAETPFADIKAYLRWHALSSAAPYLASEFDEEDFRFFSTVLHGTPEQSPRWKRAARELDDAIGFAVGEIYVARYFPPAVRDRLNGMVDMMREVLADRIEDLDWMSDETKASAFEKLDAFRVAIGYPPEWRDYTGLEFAADTYYQNVLNGARFETRRDIAKLSKPFDKTEWLMSPQMVNAYYQPSAGQLVFLAGILQPPFFDPELDDAVNFGGICAVIGHEITHGFDDKGRKYDAEANLNNWWTDEDTVKFTERAQLLVKQYNGYEVLPDVHVQGDQTLGENIADLGGVSIALEALQRSLAHKKMGLIDGFTPEQRFFIAWAQIWRTKYRDDALKSYVTTNVHSPGHLRAIGPLVNVPEFYTAFGITEDDPMWLSPEQRTKIW